MGICRDVWGDASGVWPYGKTAIPYGEMACVWEAAESHGGAAKTYGKCHGIWEPMPAHGEAARPYGEPKSHQNQEYGNVDGLRTLCIFGSTGGTAPRYVVALSTEAMPENVAVAPSAGSRDIRFMSQRSPAAGRALLARTGGLEDPGCQPRLMTGSRIGAWADRL